MEDRFHQLGSLQELTRRGWLRPLLALNQHARHVFWTAFVGSALRSGLLPLLAERPRTLEEIAAALGIDDAMTDALPEWLGVGVQLGILGRTRGRYRVANRQVRALLRPGFEPIASFYEELSYVELPVLTQTPDRLRSGDRFEIADADPAVVARASQLGEPFIAAALRQVVPPTGSIRMLEVGPGSGAHIRAAAEYNPELSAVGVELQDAAAQLARANIAAWGLADRVRIETGDALSRPPVHEFDLVTLHQNIYYFPEAERVAVLRRLAGQLRPGGRLLVTTIVRDSGPSSAVLNLWGAMTHGASRLPAVAELVADLEAAGYLGVSVHRLDGVGMYHAFVGIHG